eukprot:TRINITY_DN5270_c0_g1_i1.p1 TRINITY_DN5270_c0_g1~~TRINITY_DN5270_c0_g1_i1.p1  ORF type:complete len:208 (+),score=28.82 TRINITY_DN5270_c0_g1_i1:72-626(+)
MSHLVSSEMNSKLFVQLYPLAWIYAAYLTVNSISGCSATLSVVLSGSMEPQMKRGDIIFAIRPTNLQIGDVVLYQLPHHQIPIVHRITHFVGQDKVLTKGDANPVDDRGLYHPSSDFLPRSAILGKVRGQIPWLGYLSIWMKENMWAVALLIGVEIYRNMNNDSTYVPKGRSEWLKFLLYPGLS